MVNCTWDLRHILTCAFSVLLFLCIGAACTDNKDVEDLPTTESAILSEIRQGASLVTTEVKVRKLAIYDSSKHEKVRLTDPLTWKYGDRKCIVPVDITIKYGYDLKELSIDDIRLSEDSTVVVVLLPKPKIIDSGYEAKVNEKNVVRMSSGLRDEISQTEVDQIMRNAYKSVIEEDYTALLEGEIERNAEIVFTSIVRSIGLQNASVIVHRKEAWE